MIEMRYDVLLNFLHAPILHSRFESLAQLGEAILDKNPDAGDVREKLIQLQNDHQHIYDLWNQKNQDLKDSMELQVSDGGHWLNTALGQGFQSANTSKFISIGQCKKKHNSSALAVELRLSCNNP